MTEIVLCHGAWSSVWAWTRMRPLMAEAGHRFWAPTYTGLGARLHLASPDVNLETHISDVMGVIETEELRDVVLLGHSYGGMVATGVADRAFDRVRQVIYLDAFVPGDGHSVFDLLPQDHRSRMSAAVEAGDGWRIPPNPSPPDTAEADLDWIARHRVPMPVACFQQKLTLSAEPACPRHYIYARRNMPGDPFRPFYERAQSQSGWTAQALDVSHSPNITAPKTLMASLTTALSA